VVLLLPAVLLVSAAGSVGTGAAATPQHVKRIVVASPALGYLELVRLQFG
jgi:hypothetical protein